MNNGQTASGIGHVEPGSKPGGDVKKSTGSVGSHTLVSGGQNPGANIAHEAGGGTLLIING